MHDKQSKNHSQSSDNKTVQSALKILGTPSGKNRLTLLLPFLGPAFIASVAYVDPGNFATNIQGGAQFGSMLIWIIVVSNLMAMLIQTLSTKLGLVTGKNLAEHCREQFPRPVVLVMSQVVLSFGLPFAIVPLVLFTRNEMIMREMVNKPVTTALAGLIAGIILLTSTFSFNCSASGVISCSSILSFRSMAHGWLNRLCLPLPTWLVSLPRWSRSFM